MGQIALSFQSKMPEKFWDKDTTNVVWMAMKSG